MSLHSINEDQRLYVEPCGEGFTCVGFDVAERWRCETLEWLGVPYVEMDSGTKEHYNSYCEAMAAGLAYNLATGERCNSELIPELIGLEGCRVEVTAPDGERTRFIVGKSMGWRPCHLEIKTRASRGGCAAYIPKGAKIRVVSRP